MTRTVTEWLALSDELGKKLAEVLTPGPWKHYIKPIIDPEYSYGCTKCEKKNKSYARLAFTADCSVPDPITIDWNTAMEWRDKTVRKYGAKEFRRAMSRTVMCQVNTEPKTVHLQVLFGANWFSVYAQPKHYLIAAAMSKDKNE